MELNLLDEDKTPLTISEDIINYLRGQDAGEAEDIGYEKLTNFTELQIRDILEDLLLKFENKQRLKEHYAARVAAHNQQELFDLKNVLASFQIDDEMFEALTFREALLISHLNNETLELAPVGGLVLDIQKAEGRQTSVRYTDEIEQRLQRIFNEKRDVIHNRSISSKESEEVVSHEINLEDPLSVQVNRNTWKFLIHLTSQFDVEGSNAGSAITSWVDKEFHTLEELRREFLVGGTAEDRKSSEKTLYVGLAKKHYYVKHKSTAEKTEDRKFYSLVKARDFISEGSNFLLLRYLAISRYIGKFELSAMYINGDMCRNIYMCTGPEGRTVNDTKIDVCLIHRTVIEECGIEHKCLTVLTLQGQIVRQEWEDLTYILEVNPLAEIRNEKPAGNEHILLKNSWVADMQLFSKYLDEKERVELQIKSYMIDHPEFKQMLVDYINAILLLKPEDIIEFTINHFLSFAPEKMPANSYFG